MESSQKSVPGKFKIAVIGLGLIGGSFAYALRGFQEAFISGADVDREVLKKALEKGAVDYASDDIADVVKDADLVIFGVYPHHLTEILKKYGGYFKAGAVITDVCGVKTHLYKIIEAYIPDSVDYVGIHPMAGREVDGFDNANGNLFKETGFIIVPLPSTKPESMALMKKMATYIGASRIAVSHPVEHDGIIAYTSDLMHISASGLCMDFHPNMSLAFTAGAYRDCTRIANINPALWTELLLENSENILVHLDQIYREFKQNQKCTVRA